MPNPSTRVDPSAVMTTPVYSQYQSLRFVVTMVLIYGAFHVAYHAIPDAILRDVVYFHGFVQPSSWLVNWLNPAEGVAAVGNQMRSPRAVLEIVRGCDGSGVWFLVSAAVLAFPASWRMRAVGVLAGAALVYCLNLARLVGLYFVAGYRGSWFLPLHTYFVPTLLIVVICLFFMQWAARAAAVHDRAR